MNQTLTFHYLKGSSNIHYLHTDHTTTALSTGLGSWTAVTDETGTIVDEQSYDVCSVKLGFWECSEPKGLVEQIPPEARRREGNRRNPYTWRNSGLWQHACFDRGFTGHEHLDSFQLINPDTLHFIAFSGSATANFSLHFVCENQASAGMNGRMYDPVVSRMLAPDNFVQTPDFSQNFNRYSYCLNNPLMFTDPDGEFIIEAMMIGAFINAAIQTATGNVNNVGDFFLAAGIGAVSGAAGAGAGGVVANAVGTIGFAGGAITGAAEGFAGGLIGGAGNAWAGGANFGQGLTQGFIGGGFGAVAGGLIGGVTGGIRASKHGGDFWMGDGMIFESKVSTSEVGGSGFKFKNDKEMLAWLAENNVDLNDFGVQKLTAYEDVDFTRGLYEYFRGDDGFIYKMNSENFTLSKLGGFARLNGGLFTRTTDIFMSRFDDFFKFVGVLNHELIHAYHFSQGLHLGFGSGFRAYTERVAYEYGAGIGINPMSQALKWVPPPYAPIKPSYLVPLPKK
jgi:RHS repeat-associated protein